MMPAQPCHGAGAPPNTTRTAQAIGGVQLGRRSPMVLIDVSSIDQFTLAQVGALVHVEKWLHYGERVDVDRVLRLFDGDREQATAFLHLAREHDILRMDRMPSWAVTRGSEQ